MNFGVLTTPNELTEDCCSTYPMESEIFRMLCRGGLGHRCRMGTPILIVYLDVRSVKCLPFSRAVKGEKGPCVHTWKIQLSCKCQWLHWSLSYPAMARSSSEFPCYLVPPSPSSRAEVWDPQGKMRRNFPWSLVKSLEPKLEKKKKKEIINHSWYH